MAQFDYSPAYRNLTDAISRDLLFVVVAAAACYGLNEWYRATGSLVSLIAGSLITFLLGFVFCYLSHEWGHYIGARLAGANIPLGSGNGAFLGLFDPDRYSRRQFMWMGVGGDIGYLIPAPVLIAVFWDWPPLQGLAVAGAAFIVQSLSVDVPVLWKIHKGADINAPLAEGTAGPVIRRKTAISWGALAVGIVIFALLV
ncbi:MAG: hypothetical protein R3360_00140 [Alphaproteobacteria bacterium]|nr:hypothetical protein [Alphaproteobacteria bacterium]